MNNIIIIETTMAIFIFGILVYMMYNTAKKSAENRERFLELQRNKGIVRYEHHGYETSVKQKYKGKHKDMCLCYVCNKFEPMGSNCYIAQKLFELDKSARITTPVLECACFETKEQ